MKLISLLFIITNFNSALANEGPLSEDPRFYYGDNSRSPSFREPLKDRLHFVLNSFHIARNNDFDIIEDFCHEEDKDGCYRHKSHSYKKARQYLFGSIHLRGNSKNNYYVTTTYCQDVITNDVLPDGTNLGPMKVPSANVINTEHAWPQSRFTGKFPKAYQKSDLHALFPVRMRVNSTRGNNPFGNVSKSKTRLCKKALFGTSDKGGGNVFEPADETKGNIARAIFYFATRYSIKLDAFQETTLRQWHNMDPVDFDEQVRNEAIYNIQFNRNPYIDNPDWVDEVEDF